MNKNTKKSTKNATKTACRKKTGAKNSAPSVEEIIRHESGMASEKDDPGVTDDAPNSHLAKYRMVSSSDNGAADAAKS